MIPDWYWFYTKCCENNGTEPKGLDSLDEEETKALQNIHATAVECYSEQG